MAATPAVPVSLPFLMTPWQFYIYMINKALPIVSQRRKELCWVQCAVSVSSCHDKQDIQLRIYLLCLTVSATWFTSFPWNWCLNLCFLHTHVLGLLLPSAWWAVMSCWQGPYSAPETRLQVCNPLPASPPRVNLPKWKALEIKMLRSTEGARQEMYPVPGPCSAEHHFTGQIWCCQATNLKANAHFSAWSQRSGVFHLSGCV